MNSAERSGRAMASRRDFLESSATVAGAALASSLLAPAMVHAAGGEEIKIALIGCGGRGTGAAAQALSTAGPVKLWAMADAFEDRLHSTLKNLSAGRIGGYDTPTHRDFGGKIDVPPERRFVGLDAFQKAIAERRRCGGPRRAARLPAHALRGGGEGRQARLHGKTLASDAPGVRQILAAGRRGQAKGPEGRRRACSAATRPATWKPSRKLQDGAIGKIRRLRCYWEGGPPAKRPRDRNGLTEMQYQVRNWYFFTWLSGDHIVEQHIHNIDVCNWLMNAQPVEAQGMGGRQVRTARSGGRFSTTTSWSSPTPTGRRCSASAARFPAAGTTSASTPWGAADRPISPMPWCSRRAPSAWHSGRRRAAGASARKGPAVNPYQVEHDVLFDAIRNNRRTTRSSTRP